MARKCSAISGNVGHNTVLCAMIISKIVLSQKLLNLLKLKIYIDGYLQHYS